MKQRIVLSVSILVGIVVSVGWLRLRGRCAAETVPPPGGDHGLPSAKEIAMLPPDGGPEFNRLIFETSPYLLQHARNPVDWYPWGEEAFARARKENKPIFLSVGYSTCHWCHVMEHESFENEALAAFLNAHYVALKVDREERPDLDEVYMNATQLMTGSGGWPNSVWLLPDGRPWYCGTYFPPEDRFGRPGFLSVLRQLDDVWRNKRDVVEAQAKQLTEAIQKMGSRDNSAGGGDLRPELVSTAIGQLRLSHDRRFGGFGGAPKFPPHGSLALLFDEYRRTKDATLLKMATHTLDQMALGGIHDHVGGGFHRYSTDDHWFLPHFEKMLYDNAQLGEAYVEAFRLTGQQRYRRVAEGIFDWVLREMTDKAGGFYSALDADSDGEEGKFYVWTQREILDLLGDDLGKRFCQVYGVTEDGNFRDEALGLKSGANILHLARSLEESAQEFGVAPGELRQQMRKARQRLLSVRQKRVWPHLDDKVLTAWNALMIRSLARGGQHLDEPRYLAAATRAADFVLTTMQRDGKLLRTYRQGEAKLPAYLEDYTFLASALLMLHQITGTQRWLDAAEKLLATVQSDFADPAGPGYFFTSAGHEKLLVRSKDPFDKAIPSGNGMAAQALLQLSAATGQPGPRKTAKALLAGYVDLMERAPRGTESLLLAVADYFAAEPAPARAVAETPEASLRQKPVTLAAFLSQTTVAPGDTFQLAVRLTLDDGWHVNSHQPGAKDLTPTELTISGPGLSARDLTYPKPRLRKFGFNDESLSVYEGEVWIRAKVDVARETKPGAGELRLQLSVQACTDDRCAAPQRLEVSVPFTLAAGATKGESRHRELFQRSVSSQ